MHEGLPPEVADVLRAAGWPPDRRQTEVQVAAAVKVVEPGSPTPA